MSRNPDRSIAKEEVVYLAKINITLRTSILDPQGKAVQHAIASSGWGTSARSGWESTSRFSIDDRVEADARTPRDEVCRKLLANPVMENFMVKLEKV